MSCKTCDKPVNKHQCLSQYGYYFCTRKVKGKYFSDCLLKYRQTIIPERERRVTITYHFDSGGNLA